MVMHHHGPECHLKRVACTSSGLYVHGQGHSESLYNVIVSTIFAEQLIILQPKFVGWHIICWSVLCKDWTVLFKIKVTVKVQNLIECLSILSFCTIDLLAIKLSVFMHCYIKPSTTK